MLTTGIPNRSRTSSTAERPSAPALLAVQGDDHPRGLGPVARG